jgi:dihydrofolate reductase
MQKRPEIIVAVDQYGGFGKDGKIPWHLPEDMQRFKTLTTGHVCIMGRITYEGILDMRISRNAKNNDHTPITEILPGRECYVVTSDENYQLAGATRIDALTTLMRHMLCENDQRRLFVIGGRQLYIDAMSWDPLIHMTVLKGPTYDCDVFFPVDILNRKYHIISGNESEKAYYITYQHDR